MKVHTALFVSWNIVLDKDHFCAVTRVLQLYGNSTGLAKNELEPVASIILSNDTMLNSRIRMAIPHPFISISYLEPVSATS